MDAANPGGLGGTYCGSPVGIAAAAHAVLDIIEDEDLCDPAERLGATDGYPEAVLKEAIGAFVSREAWLCIARTGSSSGWAGSKKAGISRPFTYPIRTIRCFFLPMDSFSPSPITPAST